MFPGSPVHHHRDPNGQGSPRLLTVALVAVAVLGGILVGPAAATAQQVQADPSTVDATVRDGHVVSLHSGACDVAATLAAEGVQLASRRGHFELPLVVRWPLQLRLGGGSDPLPYGAKSPPTSTPPPTRRPRTPVGSLHRHRRRHPTGTPAD